MNAYFPFYLGRKERKGIFVNDEEPFARTLSEKINESDSV
ncbi:hypothetical protein LEP1GSC058_3068 [Leptospira fainei serovar Hurstbridge str. BUT 6]|uniref:Uncharacterized protein n=1 Tax=Leptospira fainei serovar Hurstbridge str. BUT 6 TaxID=1193011 RepID=S3V0N9_9LEPT|nr:hypothetical protein LEP1GSC058_3068 [Leptospira fainei serovar Hurstbridge str. BUT 6]